jgi:hypothetical protein
MYFLIHNSWHISSPTCFGKRCHSQRLIITKVYKLAFQPR